MTRIYLIRHTQAEGNMYRIMQGHWDGGVTDTGCRQIDALAERFRGIDIDALYSSDLYRARRTAEAISRYHGQELRTDSRLREINMGDWEARFFADLIHEDSDEIKRFLSNADGLQIPGGENCSETARRMYDAIEEIALANDGRTIAVVSHGMAIRCFLAKVNGCSLADQPIGGNTSVSLLKYENGCFSAEFVNDTSHLPGTAPMWSAIPELHARSYVPGSDDELYTACYADGWKAAHGGSLSGFVPGLYLESARRHRKDHPGSVLMLYDKDRFAGLVDLDTLRDSDKGTGWISLLYLRPEYRGRGVGIQILGRAVVLYRALGRQKLGLTVAESNTAAIGFYKKYGFRTVSDGPGSCGRLLRMEAELESRR